ncbi:MAG: aminopeptidase [Deltaproteobacteria bacterium]|jgi:aspartyl aminopeptidase|nr:aminopeptidase [Deltaproteobacteria bacterium]
MSQTKDKKSVNKAKDKKAQPEEKLCIWDRVGPKEREAIEAFSLGYMDFLTSCKTERKVNSHILSLFEAKGFEDLSKQPKKPKHGGYLLHHGKVLGVFVPGKADLKGGFNLIVAHGDSPRLDLKPRCVYEDGNLALLKTNLYGGLKKFQWLARPVAIWGFSTLKDGRKLDFTFGEDPSEPALTITDILPHMDRKIQREKRLTEAFPAERLNVLAGSIPAGDKEAKMRVRLGVLRILEKKWGIREDDLLSSEIEVVPAGPARPVGLDGSFVGGYGQDDRLSVYTAANALLPITKPDRPLLLVVFDREEIGSYGPAGAQSNFIVRLASAAFQAMDESGCWNGVMSALANTYAMSADVECGVDPTFKEVADELNSAKLGFGPCVTRYTGAAGKYGASEASSEYMAKIRAILDGEGIIWQNSLIGKQEEGGGGTVAYNLSHFGMDIVDSGAPLLSMHSPFEISCKADVWMTCRHYGAFLRKA